MNYLTFVLGFSSHSSSPIFRPIGGTCGRPHPRCRQQKAREQIEEVVHFRVAMFTIEAVRGSRYQVSWFLFASSHHYQVCHTQEVCAAGNDCVSSFLIKSL